MRAMSADKQTEFYHFVPVLERQVEPGAHGLVNNRINNEKSFEDNAFETYNLISSSLTDK